MGSLQFPPSARCPAPLPPSISQQRIVYINDRHRNFMSARSNSDGFKTVRKSDLINMLREKGLSKRKAASGLNWVLYCMKRALWRGENVDLPIGSIHAKSSPAGRKRRWQRFRNIQSGEV